VAGSDPDLTRFRQFLGFNRLYRGGDARPKPAPQVWKLQPKRLRPPLLDGSNPGTFEVPSPDGAALATEQDFNLAIRTAQGGRQLTSGGSEAQPWVVDSLSWSPDGARVAAFRLDHTGVARLPLVDWLGAVETIEWRHYTRAGAPMSKGDLWIVDVDSGCRRAVDLGETRDVSAFPLRWRDQGRELLVLTFDRLWRRVRLMAVDPVSGATRLILEETSPTNVAGYGAVGGPLSLAHIAPSGDRVFSVSERDGWGHLYLRDVKTARERRLTRGAFPVRAVLAVDEARGVVFFSANTDRQRPYDTHVCSVGFDGKGFRTLTDAPGRHAAWFDPTFDTFIDVHSSPSRPPQSDLRRRDGTLVRTLETADVAGLERAGWTPPEPFVVKASDGITPLHGMLYRPPDFEPGRRYPAIEVIYGGPQLTVHPRDFDQGSFGRVAQALAQLGFVTFVLDARGTPERGKPFQDVGYGAFGAHVIADHQAAVAELTQRFPFIDAGRIGVAGWSWGGYMTTRAMLTAAETYKVGVAACPVYDGLDHLAMAIEPYMGLPAENPSGYAAMSLFGLAGRLQGKLLLCHGTSDTNAPFSTTMKMADALARAGKTADLLILPGETHSFTGPTGARMYDAMARYFVEHL
jgi:dipeptidyl aminopeptidase/acylaminoacyl peptidase